MGFGVDIGSTAVKVVSVRRTFGGYKIVGAARGRVAKGAALPASCALYTAYRSSDVSEPGTVLLLDIGSDNMDIAFVRGGRLIFARNVSSGARAFDSQIAGARGCSPEEAELLKVNSANLGP